MLMATWLMMWPVATMAKQSENSWWWWLLPVGFFPQEHEFCNMNQAFWIEHVQVMVMVILHFLFDLHTYINNDYWLRQLASYIYIYLHETNIAPENGWLEYYVLLGQPCCQVQRGYGFWSVGLSFTWSSITESQKHCWCFRKICKSSSASARENLQQCWPSSEKRAPSFPLGLSEDVYIMYMMWFDPHEIYTYMYSVYEEMYV